MLTKVLAVLVAAAGVGTAGVYFAHNGGHCCPLSAAPDCCPDGACCPGGDCCQAGSCCKPGAACCPGPCCDAVAAKADCCPGGDCCAAGAACCEAAPTSKVKSGCCEAK